MIEAVAFFVLKKFRKLETAYYRKRMHMGKEVRFRHPLMVQFPENIHIGNRVSINRNCTFLAHTEITVGDNTLIGPNVTIITVNHDYRCEGLAAHTTHSLLPVHIGENVWIGANSVILPGVTIGTNAVIAAGSVVTKDISEGVIAGGNPARFIKNRFE
ncbi:MAG: hypothetical protein HZA15_05160 [Nitrospirae bacterium]|nr:hypothetical protein [Nitrospirota bacterium]